MWKGRQRGHGNWGGAAVRLTRISAGVAWRRLAKSSFSFERTTSRRPCFERLGWCGVWRCVVVCGAPFIDANGYEMGAHVLGAARSEKLVTTIPLQKGLGGYTDIGLS